MSEGTAKQARRERKQPAKPPKPARKPAPAPKKYPSREEIHDALKTIPKIASRSGFTDQEIGDIVNASLAEEEAARGAAS